MSKEVEPIEVKEKEETKKCTVRMNASKKETIKKLATKRNMSESALINEFIDKGLRVQEYEDNIDKIISQIVKAINEQLDVFLKSERKLIVKNTRASAINTYICAGLYERLLPDFRQKDFKELLETSKKQTSLYIKKEVEKGMKEKDIIDYYRWGDLY